MFAPYRFFQVCALCLAFLFIAHSPVLAQASEDEKAPMVLHQLPPEIERDMRARSQRERPPIFRASKSGIPIVVGGTVPPKFEVRVTPREEADDRHRLEQLAARVREDPRFLDVVKDAKRVEFLGGRSAVRIKNEHGEEDLRQPGRLRFFAYGINRVVFVDVDEEGGITELRVREADYQASLTRAEVERAEAIARRDPRAPADLGRFTIARALVVPPDATGERIAYVMFRHPNTHVWKYEAFVNLSKNEVNAINRVK